MKISRTAIRGLAAAVLVACAAPASQATTVVPPTFTELVARAQTVFVGQTLDVESRWVSTASGKVIVTLVTFKVEQTIKGELGGQTVLEFLGGTVGEDRMDVSGMPKFRVGDDDVLFVDESGRPMCPVVGMAHGRFRILEDPETGRLSMARYNFEPLAGVSDIGAAKTARITSAKALTLAEFSDAIDKEARRQRVAK